MRLDDRLRATVTLLLVSCLASLVACSSGSPSASSRACRLLTPSQFEAVLGPTVGPGTGRVVAGLPNVVAGQGCGASASNGDTFVVGWLRYRTSAAATSAYNATVTITSAGWARLALPGGLAARQYAVINHRRGVNSVAYLLRGRDELSFTVGTTVADEHLFNERAYMQAIISAARNWLTK